MAISNPLVLLPVNDDNSLQDLYDEKLFEFKQFFSRQLPTTKLFYAKLKKLKQITEAYLELGGEEVFMRGVSVAYQQYNSPDVKSVISIFQSQNNALKLKMNLSQSYDEIEQTAFQMIDNYKRYAECWPLIDIPENQRIKISEELDEMSLLEALSIFNNEDMTSFEEFNLLS
ncbi:MAG: hypothetical protein KC454_12180, partial [Flavobacteriales bacterium]|nr:hypothetical protein [Flavobacteriales bacterium]